MEIYNDYEIGETREDWKISKFEDYEGEVTLSNNQPHKGVCTFL